MRWSVTALVACSLGCSPTFEPDSDVDERTVERVRAPGGAAEHLVAPGVVNTLSPRGDGLLFGTGSGLYRQRGTDAPELLAPRVLEPGEPVATGAVFALAERSNGGLLVAAAHGLFVWDDHELLLSPVSARAPAPRLVAAGSNAGEERVAVVDGEHLIVFGARTAQLQPLGVEGAPSAVAVSGGDVFVAYGDRLVRLEETATGYVEHLIALDSGVIRALATERGGALWAATDTCVARRWVDADGVHWIRWELPEGAFALALDPDDFGAWVRTPTAALRLPLEEGAALEVALAAGPAPLALDLDGHLWSADPADGRLERHPGLQAPAPTFAREIGAFSNRHCLACHFADSTLPLATYAQWQRNAARIRLNLEVGTMPRGQPLPAASYRVVERWISGGLLP